MYFSTRRIVEGCCLHEYHPKCKVQLQDNPNLQLQVSDDPKVILTSVWILAISFMQLCLVCNICSHSTSLLFLNDDSCIPMCKRNVVLVESYPTETETLV